MLTLEWVEIGGSEQRLFQCFSSKHSEAFADEESILNDLHLVISVEHFGVLGNNRGFHLDYHNLQ